MKPSFCHLHCHTTYSLLDGASNIQALMQQTKILGMDALAITDHGVMYGVLDFIHAAKKEGIKPIIGCEMYVAEDMHDRKDRRRYHQLLLVKNEQGYKNLMELCSLAFTEGYYYKQRIDKKTLKKHAEGLIATTCCLAGEVLQAIVKQGEEAAEKVFCSWVDIFGEDYYIELQRHGLEDQNRCNEVLMRWSKKYNVKMIATNDVHYVKKEDSLAQDIMLCLQTGKTFDDPNRMRFHGKEFYLKSPEEMLALFSDVPEAIENTLEIVDKVTTPSLDRDVMMPTFAIPEDFASQEAYLEKLTFDCARRRYKEMTPAVQTRLQYELKTIFEMGFAGYFLIVEDMVREAKKLGVLVGPGRGSVSGSAVAYALGITNVDPLAYNLLFERFLNPERISMPDIDIDFDDEGREKVIQYLVRKYGYEQVAHIITFNTLGAKSAIRNVARVLNMPLPQANTLAKLVPNKLHITLAQACSQVPKLREYLNKPDTPEGKVIAISKTLEGSQSHTGIHAAGFIIADRPIMELIPVKKDKNTNLLVTQYDGSVVESTGLLKMDLLGLKTLSIIGDALRLIKQVHNIEINIEDIPLDDAKTFALYQEGKTIGTFQFESTAMRNFLKQLKPMLFEHLVAMNALYRPGPMKNIPTYIRRMHGKERADYLHALLQEILGATYGIPVYQEQIMQIAQKMAGYTLGQADVLRRAMGKKKHKEMERQRAIFIRGAKEKHNVPEKKSKEIFEHMIHFAAYGFNRSHSVAYSLLAYQTGYLKANYPTAYMAAVLIHNQRNMDKITLFIEECKRLGIQVKGPDVNKSHIEFSNDANNTILFGLAAIKSVGEKAVELLIKERDEHGRYEDFYDLVSRFIVANHGKAPNKKPLEMLALAGAFDGFGSLHRKQYIYAEEGELNFIERVIKYAHKQYSYKNPPPMLLFDLQPTYKAVKPTPPDCVPYSSLEKLRMEKELVGFYISGHPLAPFRVTIERFCNANSQNVASMHNTKEVRLAGMVVGMVHRQNSKGNGFAILTIEDYKGVLDIMLFGSAYEKFRNIQVDSFVYVKGFLQPRYGRDNEWTLRPHTVENLQHVLAKYTQNIQVYIPIERVTHDFVDRLGNLFDRFVGTCEVLFTFSHAATQTPVRTYVKKYRIRPSELFFEALDKEKLTYRIGIA